MMGLHVYLPLITNDKRGYKYLMYSSYREADIYSAGQETAAISKTNASLSCTQHPLILLYMLTNNTLLLCP